MISIDRVEMNSKFRLQDHKVQILGKKCKESAANRYLKAMIDKRNNYILVSISINLFRRISRYLHKGLISNGLIKNTVTIDRVFTPISVAYSE